MEPDSFYCKDPDECPKHNVHIGSIEHECTTPTVGVRELKSVKNEVEDYEVKINHTIFQAIANKKITYKDAEALFCEVINNLKQSKKHCVFVRGKSER